MAKRYPISDLTANLNRFEWLLHEDEVGAGVDGEETVVGFGFVGEYADSVLVVDKVVFD